MTLPRMVLLAALTLSGCASLVPAGLARLYALSPLETDPAMLAVALVLPAGLDLAPDSATLTLGSQREASGEILGGTFVLTETAGDPAFIPRDPAASVMFLALADADLPAVRRLQADIARWEAEDDAATQSSLSVGLGGCGVGSGPAADAVGSVYLQTGDAAPFFALLRDVKLVDLIGPDLFARIEPCP